MRTNRGKSEFESAKETTEDLHKSFEFAENIEKHAKGAPRTKLESTLMSFFDQGRKHHHALTALEFGLEVATNESPSWANPGETLARDERIIAAATKIGADIGISTAFAESGAILGGIAATSSIPLAGIAGPVLVIGGAVAAFKSDKVIQFFTDKSGINIEKSAVEAYRKLTQKEPKNYHGLYSDIPILIFDKDEVVHHAKISSYDDKIKILVDEHLSKKYCTKSDLIKPSQGTKAVTFNKKNDTENFTTLKKLLKSTDAKKAEKTSRIIFDMVEPEIHLKLLSEEERSQLIKIAEKYEETYTQNFTGAIKSFVNDANAVTDHQAFTEQMKSDQSQRESFISGQIPLLHTAYSIYSFLAPESATRVSATIFHSSQIINGAIDIPTLILQQGITAFTTDTFSFAIDSILKGINGFITLFGKSKNKEDPTLKMLQAISSQISQLREEMIEMFRIQSIALANLDLHVIAGFLKMEALIVENHREIMLQFEQLKKFMYVDRIYLEGFKKSLQQNERYHILNQINDADWKEVIDKVKTDCLLNPTAMSIDILKKGLVELVSKLRTVQRNGLTRADQASLTDLAKLANLLTIANPRLTGKASKTFADNYRLYTEQNIHLLVKYLRSHDKSTGSFPEMEALHNPAALHDLSEVARQLMQTYRRIFAYLGLPEDPVRESLNIFMQGIKNFELFIDHLSKSKISDTIYSQYLADIKQFSKYLVEYQTGAAAKYYGETVYPKIRASLNQDEILLAGLDNTKTYDFFTMYARNPDGRGWFEFVWSHTWLGEGRWGGGPWNKPSCHWKNDRPCWIPYGEIERAKNIYRETHQDRAKKIYNTVTNYHRDKQNEIEELHSFKQKDGVIKQFKDFLFYRNATITNLQTIPYYFKNTLSPILVSSWHIQQLPKSIFDAVAVGFDSPKFKWEYIPEMGSLNYQIQWESGESSYQDKFNLFNQTTRQLSGYSQNLNTLEMVHYHIYGGHQPIGTCREYDPDLRRFSDMYDVTAMHDYAKGRAPNECGHCHDPYRSTFCMPDTYEIIGMYHNGNDYSKLSDGTVSWVLSFPHTKISSEDELRIAVIVNKKRQTIVKDIWSDLASKLNSENEKVFEKDEYLSDDFKKNMMKVYLRICVNAPVLKMLFSLLINPYELDIDPSWPNIFDCNDMLRELQQHAGHRVYLHDLLDKNHAALTRMRPRVHKLIQSRRVEHYPFVQFKTEFEEFVTHVINNEVVPNIIAESKPINLYQFKQFVTEFFPILDVPLQQKLLNISPTLHKFVLQHTPHLLPEGQPKVEVVKTQQAKSFFGIPIADAAPIQVRELISYRTTGSTIECDGFPRETITMDPITGKYIFDYSITCAWQGEEIETGVMFYGLNGPCKSAEGTQDNVLELRGLYSGLRVQSEEVCSTLPPSFSEIAFESAVQGTSMGVIRGAANVIGGKNSLQATGLFYGGYYLYRLCDSFQQKPEQDYLSAMYQASVDTLWLAGSDVLLSQAAKGIKAAGDYLQHAEQKSIRLAGKVTSKLSDLVGYSIHAYEGIVAWHASPIPVRTTAQLATRFVSNVTSCYVAQKTTEKIGALVCSVAGFFRRPKQASFANEKDAIKPTMLKLVV